MCHGHGSYMGPVDRLLTYAAAYLLSPTYVPLVLILLHNVHWVQRNLVYIQLLGPCVTHVTD
jgi:hypothetical protein